MFESSYNTGSKKLLIYKESQVDPKEDSTFFITSVFSLNSISSPISINGSVPSYIINLLLEP